MAICADEGEIWKCPDHPSRQRPVGVCADCLREKLAVLCSDCASVRPCACCSSASASSSSSLSLSLASFPGESAGRGSKFAEPEFRRSRSVTVSVLRSVWLGGAGSADRRDRRESEGERRSWMWMFSWRRRLKKEKMPAEEEAGSFERKAINRTRSARSKGWYWPSPMKVFRQSKVPAKNVRERSPLRNCTEVNF